PVELLAADGPAPRRSAPADQPGAQAPREPEDETGGVSVGWRMADKKLGDLFDDFDRRKEQDAQALGERAAEEKAERARAVELLKTRVLPAVATLAEECSARGHKAKVSHKLDDSWPSVTFEFTAEQRVAGPPINL